MSYDVTVRPTLCGWVIFNNKSNHTEPLENRNLGYTVAFGLYPLSDHIPPFGISVSSLTVTQRNTSILILIISSFGFRLYPVYQQYLFPSKTGYNPKARVVLLNLAPSIFPYTMPIICLYCNKIWRKSMQHKSIRFDELNPINTIKNNFVGQN